jgi:uncharacterized RDD family membrane protein YckC
MSTAFEKIGTDRQLQDHWLRRLIAGIIDSIILWIITSIILILIPLPPWASGGVPLFGDVPGLIRGVLFFLYASFLESTRGTTLGKQIMYLKVTTTDGKLPSLNRTLLRDISKINGLLWLIDTLIGMATVGDPHQKYSDRFAGTTVVSTIGRGFILPGPPISPVPPPPST